VRHPEMAFRILQGSASGRPGGQDAAEKSGRSEAVSHVAWKTVDRGAGFLVVGGVLRAGGCPASQTMASERMTPLTEVVQA
jgi:hypothetical protein